MKARRSERFRCRFSVSCPLPMRRSAVIRFHESEAPLAPDAFCQLSRRQTRTSRFLVEVLMGPLRQGHWDGGVRAGTPGAGRLAAHGALEEVEERSFRIAGMVSDEERRGLHAELNVSRVLRAVADSCARHQR